MAQPPPYVPKTSFITYQAQQAWFPGQQLDVEFDAIDTSILAIEANLKLIQRDDGALANGSVGFAQLSTVLATALSNIGVVVPLSTILNQANTWTQRQNFNLGVTANLAPLFFNLDYLQLYAYGGLTSSAGLFLGCDRSEIGVAGAARTSTNTVAGQVAAGGFFFSFNDNTSVLYDNWAIYAENRRYPGAGGTVGIELNITELGTSVQTDCYSNAYAGLIHLSGCMFLHSGGGDTNYFDPATGLHNLNPNPAGVALAIGNNGNTFRTGIQFNWNALQGNDGVADGGFGQAIIMPRNDAVIWQYTTGPLDGSGHATTPGLIGAYIQSQVKSLDSVQKLLFLDGNQGMCLLNANNTFLFEVGVSNSYVNGLFIAPGVSGAPGVVALEATGSDTNVQLGLVPKGSGGVSIGNATPAVFSSGGKLVIANATAASGPGTGALTVAGGIGVSGTSFFGSLTSGTSNYLLVAGPNTGTGVGVGAAVAIENGGALVVSFGNRTGVLGPNAAIDMAPTFYLSSACFFYVNTTTFANQSLVVDTFNTAASSTSTGTARVQGGFAATMTSYIASLIATASGGLQAGVPTGGDKGDGTLNLKGNLFQQGTQVVGPRATGWTVATGTPQRSTFTTGGVTLPQLAGVVMALEQDLIAHGLIGT